MVNSAEMFRLII